MAFLKRTLVRPRDRHRTERLGGDAEGRSEEADFYSIDICLYELDSWTYYRITTQILLLSDLYSTITSLANSSQKFETSSQRYNFAQTDDGDSALRRWAHDQTAFAPREDAKE
ncbi:hypothetical protein F441_22267 [Phytophthora nicotianae CJ01A1]|uniref:Uncharacterized protein n=3 Tax=Phytophthora nicotianae TaxID=4792 RepID=W2JXZ5_PHYNI|nr:hypothetical protein L915_07545 [Phytophthora nicotianae]ETL50647.1 hypothetical protein L916_00140 [Phytophthora nicotianae]ETO58579.1 hypothetical protein F444_23043 [Phytophthora nicotianae P1976]ETP00313.1 hypothetical protein F441_22267 [Phytophthora nicotianae CJ01A1]